MKSSELWLNAPKGPWTTGIGSLPHHNVDAALQHAFQYSIPFLPQIPLRHRREFMVAQALDGLPGLKIGEKGEVQLESSEWLRDGSKLDRKLDDAFRSKEHDAFEEFVPHSDSYSAWTPFLWELSERGDKFAKVQLSGPLTSQWSLRLEDGSPADRHAELGSQIFKLVLARCTAMVRELKKNGITPLLFIDEPGFYCFSKQTPKHVLGLTELKLFLQALRKEDALVGMHCCSNTDWGTVLSLPLDVLSLDSRLSLNLILSAKEALGTALTSGTKLALGVIPTSGGSSALHDFDPKTAADSMKRVLTESLPAKISTKELLSKSLFTPACGLALHKTEDAERVRELLNEFIASL